MKQNIILWVAAFIITFVAGFLQSRLSERYPVSGSFGINGKEIGYKLDRVFSGEDDYTFTIKSEIENLQGKLFWKKTGEERWNSAALTDSGSYIFGKIPHQSPQTKTEYFVKLFYKNNEYFVPAGGNPVELKFLGTVPSKINIYYWLTLLGGILMAVRTGLEYFNVPGKLKKLEVFTLIFIVVNVFAFHPVKTSYELGAIGNAVPITSMFQFSSIFLFATWVIATALIFNTKNYRIWAPVAAIISILIFELGSF